MSFVATFISLAVIIGVTLVVLATVVGYGFFHEFFGKPQGHLDT